LIVGLTDARVGIMTGDAVIEQKISVLPPKSDMRVNEYRAKGAKRRFSSRELAMTFPDRSLLIYLPTGDLRCIDE
jgi:hypothetical protein